MILKYDSNARRFCMACLGVLLLRTSDCFFFFFFSQCFCQSRSTTASGMIVLGSAFHGVCCFTPLLIYWTRSLDALACLMTAIARRLFHIPFFSCHLFKHLYLMEWPTASIDISVSSRSFSRERYRDVFNDLVERMDWYWPRLIRSILAGIHASLIAACVRVTR